MFKIYIVRHGKTEWNIKGLMQGLKDIPLAKEGIKETKKLAESFEIDAIDICFSSPLKRAKQTANILCGKNKRIIYDERLKERCFGNHEGKKINYDFIAKEWDYNLNTTEDGIESIKDCLNRAKSFLTFIKKEYPNKNILIVSHGSFIKALHFNLIGYDATTNFLSFNAKNTEIYEYERVRF